MNKIDAWRVRILLKGRHWEGMAVTSSPLGGWFKVCKPYPQGVCPSDSRRCAAEQTS